MLDDELRTLVSVDPPAGFDARVRARVQAEPPHAWGWLWRPRLVAAATLAGLAAAVGAGVLSRPAAPRGASEPALVAARPLATMMAPLAAPYPPEAPPAVSARPERDAVRHTLATFAEPSGAPRFTVLLDPAERAALQRLFAAGPVEAPLSGPSTDALEFPALTIEPLTVEVDSEGARR